MVAPLGVEHVLARDHHLFLAHSWEKRGRRCMSEIMFCMLESAGQK